MLNICYSFPLTVQTSVHDASTFPFMLDFFKRCADTRHLVLFSPKRRLIPIEWRIETRFRYVTRLDRFLLGD